MHWNLHAWVTMLWFNKIQCLNCLLFWWRHNKFLKCWFRPNHDTADYIRSEFVHFESLTFYINHFLLLHSFLNRTDNTHTEMYRSTATSCQVAPLLVFLQTPCTWLGEGVTLLLSIPIKMDVCVCVCMSGHNSGMPGAISTKFGKHIAICMCKNLMYVLYTCIFRREDGMGGREFGWFTLLRNSNYCCCQVTMWSIFVATYVTWWRGI
jgi:hypothetical protein